MIDSLYRAVRPAIFHLDPERAHGLALRVLASGLVRLPREAEDPILACRIWGRDLPNPVGLAAGFDKNCEAADALFAIGFGFVEIGTVTPKPQPGNPKPRLFRLESDLALINRNGFNSDGLDVFVARLEARSGQPGFLGVNLGKNKDTAEEATDFLAGIDRTAAHAGYIVINVSSPNTPGLRALQGRDAMQRLVSAALAARARTMVGAPEPPLLVKLAPDLDEAGIRDAAEVALAEGVDGLIMGNTTVSRPDDLVSPQRGETGGLSGRPLMALSTLKLGELYRAVGGKLPLIGAGGVASGQDAYDKIRAGASLVQLYSGLVYEGPGLARRIKRELAALLRRDGFGSVGDAVGAGSER